MAKKDEVLEQFYSLDTQLNYILIHYNDKTSKTYNRHALENIKSKSLIVMSRIVSNKSYRYLFLKSSTSFEVKKVFTRLYVLSTKLVSSSGAGRSY